jgi:hypothetical protein
MHRGQPAVSKRSRPWCRSNKFDLNAGKCKSVSFRRNIQPIEFVYSNNGMALERVDEIKDLGVTLDLMIKKSLKVLIFCGFTKNHTAENSGNKLLATT